MTPKLGPVKVKIWKKFLEYKGLKFLRTNDGHELWSRKDLPRPVTFQARYKDIPGFHIGTNLRTMGVSIQEFLDFLNGTESDKTDSKSK